jgi:hypothetical protein
MSTQKSSVPRIGKRFELHTRMQEEVPAPPLT